MDECTPLSVIGDEGKKPVDETVGKSDSSDNVYDELIADNADDKTAEEVVEAIDEKSVDGAEAAEESVDGAEEADETERTEEIDTSFDEEIHSQVEYADKLFEGQAQLIERIDALTDLFNARIMHTDYEEKIVDRMHEELQRYKDDMYSQLIRPILIDIIEVRDSIMRLSAHFLSKPEGEQAIPNKTFSDYSYDLQDILEKNSVELYRSKIGDDFTPIKHRVIKKIETSDEALHGKIAESLSCGYSYNSKIISAEKITVYYYKENIENNENSEVVENG